MKLGFVSAILDTWNYEEMMCGSCMLATGKG